MSGLDLRNRMSSCKTSPTSICWVYACERMTLNAGMYTENLWADTWEIADRSRLLMLDNASSRYYHEVRRTPRSEDLSAYTLKKHAAYAGVIQWRLGSQRAVIRREMDDVLKRHEDTPQNLCFCKHGPTVHGLLKRKRRCTIHALSPNCSSVNDLCLFISAVTLSLMECFWLA